MKRAPCKECEKRYLGCHANCEEYQAWRSERIEMYEKISKEKEKQEWTYKAVRASWKKAR